MNIVRHLLFLLCFTCTALYAASDTNERRLHEIVNAFMQKYQVPGIAIQAYVHGQPKSYYFGFANREKKYAVTPLTIFEIGSISKVITNLLLAQEIDFASVQMQDSIRKYLPQLPAEFDAVTLQQLSTHTSGLPFEPEQNLESLTALTNLKVNHTEGHWQYSNLGIGLIGLALENLTQKDFDQLYLRHVVIPLKMHFITTQVPKNLMRFVAQGYDEEGEAVAPESTDLLKSAYGIKISAEDMQKFLAAAIGLPGTPERVFYPMRLTQSSFLKYGS